MLSNLNNIALIILLFTAAFFDAKEKRIPNFLTFPIILIGLTTNIIMNGLNGCLFSLYGFLIGLIVFFIPFSLGLMGGGDVKLMAAIGGLMGWKFTILSSLFSAIAGIFVVFGYLIYKKELFNYFKKILIAIAKAILKYIYFGDKNTVGHKLKKFAYSNDVEIKKNEKLYIPYGLAIALGTLFVLSGIFKKYILF